MYYQNNLTSKGALSVHSDTANFHPFNTNANHIKNSYNVPPPPLPTFIGNNEFSNPPILQTYTNNMADCGQNKESASIDSYPAHVISKWDLKDTSGKEQFKLPFSDINVSSIKTDFMRCAELLKEFERLLNLLKVFKKTLPEESWSFKCKEIKKREEELIKLLNKYEMPEYFLAAQKAVKKSSKKRKYRKKKKKEWQEFKDIKGSFREREHKRIDLWLEKMKDEVEKSQREEQVKREADIVLSDVTTKKTEAKRFINLFNNLTKLRNARVQQLKTSGGFISDSETKSFFQVTDKLKKLWLDQLSEYNLEEQGLRVMLNDAEVERVNVETKVTKQIQRKWYKFLFGESSNKQAFAADSLDELIAVRYEWDRFIVTDNNLCLSSKIPIGWVLPSQPSSSEWAKHLQK